MTKDTIVHRQLHVHSVKNSEWTRKRCSSIAEGFGLGMGMMEVCGALSGMMMIIGLQNSVGNPEKGKMTKGDTYKKVREHACNKFAEQNGSYLCKELKGRRDRQSSP